MIKSITEYLDKHWFFFLIIYFIGCLSLASSLAAMIWDPLTSANMNPSGNITANIESLNNSVSTLTNSVSTLTNSVSTLTNSVSTLTNTTTSSTTIINPPTDPNEENITTSNQTEGNNLLNMALAQETKDNNNAEQKPENPTSEQELRLFQLSFLFGAIGASIHGLTSLSTWYGNNKLKRSFLVWYLTRPLIGAALALVVYLLLRASLLSTTTSSFEFSGVSYINDFGVAGISALVGLMTTQMTQKLRDVFDSLFGINKGTDKGDIRTTQDKLSLNPQEITLGIQEEYVIIITAKDSDSSPISNVEIELVINNNNVVELLEKSNKKKTDNNGFTMYRIKGKETGETRVHAFAEIDKKTKYSNGVIKVTPSSEVQISFPENLNPRKKVEVGKILELKAEVTNDAGDLISTPQAVTFKVSDQSILEFVDIQTEGLNGVTKETGEDGSVTVKVKGIKSGETEVTAAIMTQGDQAQSVTAEIKVEVTPSSSE